MRDIWQVVRTPLLTIGVIVVTIAVGMRQLAGNDRRWAIVSNGVVLVSAYDTSRFLQDSVVMVTRRSGSTTRISRHTWAIRSLHSSCR